MGVSGLWDVIRPAGNIRSLTELSITEGFEANPDGVRGFRIGIDASIWFFHAEYGKEGENPVLRTLFFRCATLMHSPFLPLFVFDGPKRPEWKRGKKINRTGNKLIPGMKAIVESFGFEWRMAPGEAEAELAYLNRIGLIDGILSDDVDNFLFGATTVIRNPSNNLSGNRANPVLNAAGKDDKNHTKVYQLSDITSHPDVRLTRGGMILIGLLSGGDYHQGGLNRCGIVTSHGLAKCGFGDTLFQAATNMNRDQLKTFLVAWRHELCHELRTNSQGHIGRKQVSLANSVPSDFPDIDILMSYVNPITSESMGRTENTSKFTWSKEPDLGKLAATCELYFEWGYKEAIIKRFRTVIWHSAVLRILRRAVLDLDARPTNRALPPTTPRKAGKHLREPIGTPSKMIAKHFSTLVLNDTSDSEDEDEPLIIKIHSERRHVSTDEILEYRLEVAPAQLVRIAESGLQGLRTPEGPDEWADEDDEDGDGKGVKKPPPDPDSHMRVWMPACMVRLVEPRLVEEFEAVQEKKRSKKSAKGRGKTSTTAIPAHDDASRVEDRLVSKSKKTIPPHSKNNSAPANPRQLEPESDERELSPPPSPSRTVRDLTKKKTTDTTTMGLKSFFVTTKASSSVAKSKNFTTLSKNASSIISQEGISGQVVKPPGPVTDVEKPTTSTTQVSQAYASDLTKKKANMKSQGHSYSTPIDSFLNLAKLSPPKIIHSNAVASTSKAKTCVDVSSDEETDTNPMLASPIKPNRSAAWNSASEGTYITVSDSDDDNRGNGRLGPDDSHLYESDDPFDDTPRRSLPKPKQANKTTSSISLDLNTTGRHLQKSPRKSKEHTSPRKGYTVPKSDTQPPLSPLNRKSHPLPLVEVSDSDDELPPVSRIIDEAPLLRARARLTGKANGRQQTLDQFTRPIEKRKLVISNEIIDLT